MNASNAPAWEAIESVSRDELSAIQLERLKQTLGWAYEKVHHYRQAFDEAGVEPGALKNLNETFSGSFQRPCKFTI